MRQDALRTLLVNPPFIGLRRFFHLSHRRVQVKKEAGREAEAPK